MGKFNVGDYIISRVTHKAVWKIYHEDEVFYHGESVKGTRKTILVKKDEPRQKLLAVESGYRRATVLDYIRTLSAEQMTRILQIAEKKCRFCVDRRKDTGDCKYYTHLPEECDKGIAEWLNQPLTDELVEWLGGK